MAAVAIKQGPPAPPKTTAAADSSHGGGGADSGDAVSAAAVAVAARAAVRDAGDFLRERCAPPWSAVLPVSWQLGPQELLAYLLDKESVLTDKVPPPTVPLRRDLLDLTP